MITSDVSESAQLIYLFKVAQQDTQLWFRGTPV